MASAYFPSAICSRAAKFDDSGHVAEVSNLRQQDFKHMPLPQRHVPIAVLAATASSRHPFGDLAAELVDEFSHTVARQFVERRFQPTVHAIHANYFLNCEGSSQMRVEMATYSAIALAYIGMASPGVVSRNVGSR